MDSNFVNEIIVTDNHNHNNGIGNDETGLVKNAGEDIKESSLLKDIDAILQDDSFNMDVDISKFHLPNPPVLENELRRILLRWRRGDYKQMPSSLFLAYFLQKKYDLSERKPVLAGKDAHKVFFVDAVAGDLGYVVFLADYERLVIRQNHHLHGIVSKTTINISRIVDVNGKPISGDSILRPQLDSVIEPKDLEPDAEWTIEGIHIWLDSTISRHWFRGTVFLLIHADDVEDILIAAMEVQDAFLELRSCSAAGYPTAKTKKLVRHILELLASDCAIDRSFFGNLAEFALDRHDLDLWNQVVALLGEDGDINLPLLKRSCQVFGFNVSRPSLERALSFSTLGETLAFTNDLPSYLSQFEDTAELDAWYKEQVINRLKVFSHWDDNYVLHLMMVARTFGIRCLFSIPLVDIQDYEWEYVLDFAENLQHDRQSILSLRVNQMTSDDAFEGLDEVVDPSGTPDQVMNRLMHRLVYHVFKQVTLSLRWLDERGKRCWCYTCLEKIQIKSTCIRLFMMSGQNCQEMLQDILDLPLKDEALKLREIYIPLVQYLCPLLKEFKHTEYSSTFGPFICHVIELYSRLLMGSRTYNPQFEPLLRVIEEKFGCDCRECVNLKSFMKQFYVPERTFLVSRTGMRHFAGQLRQAFRLAWYEKLPSPHGYCIKVVKSHVFSEHRWDVRVRHFRDVLRSIGDEDVIEKLMGDGYIDLKKSMES